MKAAIVSDSHDNLANFKKAVDLIKKKKIKIIIHCGDISKPESLKEALLGFKGKIHIVFGNADKNMFNKKEREIKEIELDKKKIAFTHFPSRAKKLALSQKYDLVFYGHTHKPWEEKIEKTRLVNPGNLAGLWYRATFAVYDTKTSKLTLEIL